MMARGGACPKSNSDWFNRINATLFKYKFVTVCLYPIFKMIRSFLLWVRGTPRIKSHCDVPLYQLIFQEPIEEIEEVFKKRYANRFYSDDLVTFKGKVTVEISAFFRSFSWLFRLFRVFVPYAGVDVPVTVTVRSDLNSKRIFFNRVFCFPGKKPCSFNSVFFHDKDNMFIEFVRFGVGLRSVFFYQEGKLFIKHSGYVIRFFKWMIPLPLNFLLGKSDVEEVAISDVQFSMRVSMVHPWFGRLIQYSGDFSIMDDNG